MSVGKVEKTTFEVSGEVAELLMSRGAGVREPTLFALPDRVENGVGWYRDDSLTVPKEMRSRGVNSELLHAQENRTVLSEYSDEIVVAFFWGLSQNMTWDMAKAAASYMIAWVSGHGTTDREACVEVSIAKINRADGGTVKGVTIRGPVNEEVASEIIKALTGEVG